MISTYLLKYVITDYYYPQTQFLVDFNWIFLYLPGVSSHQLIPFAPISLKALSQQLTRLVGAFKRVRNETRWEFEKCGVCFKRTTSKKVSLARCSLTKQVSSSQTEDLVLFHLIPKRELQRNCTLPSEILDSLSSLSYFSGIRMGCWFRMYICIFCEFLSFFIICFLDVDFNYIFFTSVIHTFDQLLKFIIWICNWHYILNI